MDESEIRAAIGEATGFQRLKRNEGYSVADVIAVVRHLEAKLTPPPPAPRKPVNKVVVKVEGHYDDMEKPLVTTIEAEYSHTDRVLGKSMAVTREVRRILES